MFSDFFDMRGAHCKLQSTSNRNGIHLLKYTYIVHYLEYHMQAEKGTCPIQHLQEK